MSRTLQQWLDEYGESHQHPVNKAIHRVCVPAITFTVISLLSLTPGLKGRAWPDLGTVFAILAVLFFYLRLSPILALWMFAFAASVQIVTELAVIAGEFWVVLWINLTIFALAWAGQFIGHSKLFEGKKPKFFKDLQFLLIGPLWVLVEIHRKRGWYY